MKSIFLSALAAISLTSHSVAMEYEGFCEASAGVYLTQTHFAVASDETNRIQIYERGKPGPVGIVDLTSFTGYDKSDIEGAAIVGNRIYWISSHSFNKSGEDKRKRKILFATNIEKDGDRVSLFGTFRPVGDIRDPLVKATGLDPAKIDIEGLASNEKGQLLIGLRAPLQEGKALVVLLKNPGDVVESRSAPDFETKPLELDLGGRGIRSMERVGSGPHPYLILAGPVADADGFELYWWSGKDEVSPANGSKLDKMTPEALMAIPGTSTIQILSDDGKDCKGSDEDPPTAARKFRSVEFDP